MGQKIVILPEELVTFPTFWRARTLGPSVSPLSRNVDDPRPPMFRLRAAPQTGDFLARSAFLASIRIMIAEYDSNIAWHVICLEAGPRICSYVCGRLLRPPHPWSDHVSGDTSHSDRSLR